MLWVILGLVAFGFLTIVIAGKEKFDAKQKKIEEEKEESKFIRNIRKKK